LGDSLVLFLPLPSHRASPSEEYSAI
jgi:hypothetical protein